MTLRRKIKCEETSRNSRFSPKILITSASSDRVNSNSAIRSYLASGFRDILPSSDVADCPVELAENVLTHFKPFAVIVVGSLASDSTNLQAWLYNAKRLGIKIAVWVHDDPYEFDYCFKITDIADIIFTNDKWCSYHYDAENVVHLPLAGCPEVHFRPIRPMADRLTDLFFCGVAYSNRVDLIINIQKNLPDVKFSITGSGWPNSVKYSVNKRLSASEVADRASLSKFSLNIGRDLNVANKRFRLPPSTPGPRTFEAALSGTVQLFYVTGLEIADYLDINSEIITIDDVQQIKESIRKSYHDPGAILQIASRAQERVLNEHTYTHRAIRILQEIREV